MSDLSPHNNFNPFSFIDGLFFWVCERNKDRGEFVISGLIAFLAFVILGHVAFETSRRNWKSMYEQRVIDRKEYYENRFKFF